MDGYFISDSQVQAICELVSYRFRCYKVNGQMDYVEWTKKLIKDGNVKYDDPVEYSYGIDLSKDTIRNYTYRKTPDYSTGSGKDQTDFKDLRVPELAPMSISNFYTVISYDYVDAADEEENGARECVSMTVTVDADRFVTMVTNLIPDFTFAHFYELLELLPGTQKEIEKYKCIERLYQDGEAARERYENALSSGLETNITLEEVAAAYQKKTVTYGEFPSCGVYAGRGAYAQRSTGANFYGYGGIWVGSHMEDGEIADSPRYTKASYEGWFSIDPAAEIPMDSSDGLSVSQISDVCRMAASWGNAANPEVPFYMRQEETAQALYDWQEEKNASVTAVLAIIKTEGNLTNGRAESTWNLLNWGNRDFKAEHGTGAYMKDTDGFIKALTEQMDLVTDQYIKNGQETYFKMQWGADFDSQVPSQDAYEEAEQKITHSFCPWWDDCAFPFRLYYEGEDAGTLNGKGWCNTCADVRAKLLSSAGITVVSGYTWPVPDYTKISSPFGLREAPTAGASTDHKGTDIAAPLGSPILAVADGTVTEVSLGESTGYVVRIQHDDGLMQTRYIHMKTEPIVKEGDKVHAGQQIAEVGSAGISTGPHLHIEFKENGVLVDPMNYLSEPQRMVTLANANEAGMAAGAGTGYSPKYAKDAALISWE